MPTTIHRSDIGQTKVQISLNARIRCKTDMVAIAVDVWNWDSPKKTVRCNYPGSRCLAGGLSWMLLSGRRRHRSRDKDGRYTIGSAMAETPCCTQTSRLSFLRPKLLPIKVFHCVYREFRYLLRKWQKILNI